MNKELQSIIRNLQRVNTAQPWFGRPVYEILDEVDPKKADIKPNGSGHTLTELIYHLLTWTEFVLKRIEGGKEADLSAFDKLDWREIDPKEHTWKKGVTAFKSANDKIIQLLADKDDTLLSEIVDYREYNFRFMLNGLIQHHIYHLGQIAYIHKFLV